MYTPYCSPVVSLTAPGLLEDEPSSPKFPPGLSPSLHLEVQDSGRKLYQKPTRGMNHTIEHAHMLIAVAF